MTDKQTDITVIIVNYKVKEYIANLISSLFKAKNELSLQIIVVDNNSEDNSIPFLKERFTDVTYIGNSENKGFGKANNQGIKIAEGTYTLLINPDTLVSEDTLSVMFKYMQENPKCGVAGCKILNPDGTFARECRRSVPDLKAALFRVFGLDSTFPKSKLFGKRYLGWLDIDEANKVPVISGSFMFWRTEFLQELNGFDERFFMYGEDDDICYRVENTDYFIQYLPSTSIIHYKGESAKRDSIKHTRVFNNALHQFFNKHYSKQYSFFARSLIYIAVQLKIIFSVIKNVFIKIRNVLIDILILNISIICGFGIRYSMKGVNIFTPDGFKFLWINLLASLLYILVGSILGLLGEKGKSASTSLKALVSTYAGVVIVTFFARNLAYTRLGLAFGLLIGLVLLFLYALYIANQKGSKVNKKGKLNNVRVLIVGEKDETLRLTNMIHSRPDWNYEVVGRITGDSDNKDEGFIGSLAQLKDLIRIHNADQIFFMLYSISYKKMLEQITHLQDQEVTFKLIPDSMDFILGKSNVEYLESIPLIEVDLSYSKGFNKFLKRTLDVIIALPVWLILIMFRGPNILLSKEKKKKIAECYFYQNPRENIWNNLVLLLGYIVSGKLSMVGSPIYSLSNTSRYNLEKGFTGLIQLNQSQLQEAEHKESYELYYMQNYSIWMDIDILLKTLFNGFPLVDQLEKAFEQLD